MPFGEAASLNAQITSLLTMQNQATSNGNGQAVSVDGYNGLQNVEILEFAGGTGTITLQGSYDAANWHSVGYQQVDGVAAPSRAVAPISVTADSAHVYEVLDGYRYLRAVISNIASAQITARVYTMPV